MSKLVNFYDLKEVQEMREASHNPHFKDNDTDLPHHLSHRSQREAGAILSGIRGTMGHFILLISNIL